MIKIWDLRSPDAAVRWNHDALAALRGGGNSPTVAICYIEIYRQLRTATQPVGPIPAVAIYVYIFFA